MEFSRQSILEWIAFPSSQASSQHRDPIVNPKKQPELCRFMGRNQEIKNKAMGLIETGPLSLEGSQSPGTMRHKERSHGKHLTPPLSWTDTREGGEDEVPGYQPCPGHSGLSRLCLWGFCPVFSLHHKPHRTPLPESIQPDYNLQHQSLPEAPVRCEIPDLPEPKVLIHRQLHPPWRSECAQGVAAHHALSEASQSLFSVAYSNLIVS